MFAAAVADKLIATSPTVGVRLPEIESRDYFVPAPDQIHRLADELAERYSPVPYIAAGCGLRGSEIFGVELGHVDFLARQIHVRQQLKRMVGQPAHLGELKTDESAHRRAS
jgi:integrase